jgi:hypothetical protein
VQSTLLETSGETRGIRLSICKNWIADSTGAEVLAGLFWAIIASLLLAIMVWVLPSYSRSISAPGALYQGVTNCMNMPTADLRRGGAGSERC